MQGMGWGRMWHMQGMEWCGLATCCLESKISPRRYAPLRYGQTHSCQYLEGDVGDVVVGKAQAAQIRQLEQQVGQGGYLQCVEVWGSVKDDKGSADPAAQAAGRPGRTPEGEDEV